jgi:putative oxidoreductase
MSQTKLSPPDAAMRRFLIVQFGVLGAFAVVMIAVEAVIPTVKTPWQRWLLAAGPAALLLVWAWEFFRVIRAQDEMMQTIHLRVVATAACLVLLGASLWGIPERLLNAPELPASLLLPIFAFVYGAAWAMTGGRR